MPETVNNNKGGGVLGYWGRPGGPPHRALGNREHFEVELESRIRWDVGRRTFGAVGKTGGDSDSSFTTHPHAGDSNVPALDHLAGPEREAERFAFFVRFLGSFLSAVGSGAGDLASPL